MIDFEMLEHDDPEFVALARRIIVGALEVFRPEEVYVVHVDNWFDHKWLGYYSPREGELTVPPLNPNRVCSQRHYVRLAGESGWSYAGSGEAVHVHQPGRPSRMKVLKDVARSAAFVWYSGNTRQNRRGGLMLYVRTPDGQCAWYATLKANGDWRIERGCRVTLRELRDFESRGRRLEQAAPRSPHEDILD